MTAAPTNSWRSTLLSTPSQIPAQTYVVGAHVLSIVRDGVAVISERPGKPAGLPGGKPDAGESLAEALTRELLEECNCDVPIDAFDWDVSIECANDTRYECHFVLTKRSLPNCEYPLIKDIVALVQAGKVAPYVERVLRRCGLIVERIPEPSVPVPCPVPSSAREQSVLAADYKTQLNNWCMRAGILPKYSSVRTGGEDHVPVFEATVVVGTGLRYRVFSGLGRNKAVAESRAAQAAVDAVSQTAGDVSRFLSMCGSFNPYGNGQPVFTSVQYISFSAASPSATSFTLTPPVGTSRVQLQFSCSNATAQVVGFTVGTTSRLMPIGIPNVVNTVPTSAIGFLSHPVNGATDRTFEFDWNTTLSPMVLSVQTYLSGAVSLLIGVTYSFLGDAVYIAGADPSVVLNQNVSQVGGTSVASPLPVSIHGIPTNDPMSVDVTHVAGSITPVSAGRMPIDVAALAGSTAGVNTQGLRTDISRVAGSTLVTPFVPVSSGSGGAAVDVKVIGIDSLTAPLWTSAYNPVAAPIDASVGSQAARAQAAQLAATQKGGFDAYGNQQPKYVGAKGKLFEISDAEFDEAKLMSRTYIADCAKRRSYRVAAARLTSWFHNDDSLWIDEGEKVVAVPDSSTERVQKESAPAKPRSRAAVPEATNPAAAASAKEHVDASAKWLKSIQRVSKFVTDSLSAVRWWYRNSETVDIKFFREVVVYARVEADLTPAGRALAHLMGSISELQEMRSHAMFLRCPDRISHWSAVWEDHALEPWFCAPAEAVITSLHNDDGDAVANALALKGSYNAYGNQQRRGGYARTDSMGGSDPGPMVPLTMTELRGLKSLSTSVAGSAVSGGSFNRLAQAALMSGLGTVVNPATISATTTDSIRATCIAANGVVTDVKSEPPRETWLIPRSVRTVVAAAPVNSNAPLAAQAVASTLSGGADLGFTATGSLVTVQNAAATAVTIKSTDTTQQGWPTADIAYAVSTPIVNRWNAEEWCMRSIALWSVSNYCQQGDVPDQLFYPIRAADPLAYSTGAGQQLQWNTCPLNNEDCGGIAAPVFPFGGGAGTISFHATINTVPEAQRARAIYIPQGMANGNVMREQTLALLIQPWCEWPFAMPNVIANTTYADGTFNAATRYAVTQALIRIPGLKDVHVILPRGQNGGAPPGDQATANGIVTVRPFWGPLATGGQAAGAPLNVAFLGNVPQYPLAAYLLSWAANGANTAPGIALQSFTTLWKLVNDSAEILGAFNVASEKFAILSTRYRPMWLSARDAFPALQQADDDSSSPWIRADGPVVFEVAGNWPQASSPDPALWIAATSLAAWNGIATESMEVLSRPTIGAIWDAAYTSPRGLYLQSLVARAYAATFQTIYTYLGLPVDTWSNLLNRAPITSIREIVNSFYCTSNHGGSVALPPSAGMIAATYGHVTGYAPAAQTGCLSFGSSRMPPNPGAWKHVWSPLAVAFNGTVVPGVLNDIAYHVMCNALNLDMAPFVPQLLEDGCVGLPDLSGRQLQMAGGGHYSAVWLPQSEQVGWLNMLEMPTYCETVIWNSRVSWCGSPSVLRDITGAIMVGSVPTATDVIGAPFAAVAGSAEALLNPVNVRRTSWIPRYTDGGARVYVAVAQADVQAHNYRMLGVSRFAIEVWLLRATSAPPAILTQNTRGDIKSLIPSWTAEVRVLDVVGPQAVARPGIWSGRWGGAGPVGDGAPNPLGGGNAGRGGAAGGGGGGGGGGAGDGPRDPNDVRNNGLVANVADAAALLVAGNDMVGGVAGLVNIAQNVNAGVNAAVQQAAAVGVAAIPRVARLLGAPNGVGQLGGEAGQPAN